MRNFRSNLTRINNKIIEIFPDGNDVYDYPGINKDMLISSLDMIYDLSKHIEDESDYPFEVISLKRMCARVYDEFNSAIKKENIEFAINPFFNMLSELIDKTKHTYLIFTGKGFKTEKEYSGLKLKLDNLKELHHQYETDLEKISQIKSKIEEANETITNIDNEISDVHERTIGYSEDINTKKEEYDEIYESVEGWNEEILESRTNIKIIREEIKDLQSQYNKLAASVEDSEKRSKTILDRIETQQDKNDLFQEQIEQTLGNANRFGMAGSFKERKKEVTITQTAWMIIFVFSLLLISGISFLVFIWMPITDSLNIFTLESLGKLLTRLAVISPLLWMSWFSAKQYTQTNKIREDYSYKYASSMAYEGYKKAAMDCDEELATKLLDSSITSLSQHPIRLFSKGNEHASPITEIIESFSKLPLLKNISFSLPTASGKMEFELYKKETEQLDEE